MPSQKKPAGYFTPDGLEYVITRPDLPRPWVNFLTNKRYCAYFSHTGGGYSFVDDSGYNRILREKPGDEILEDRPGRYFYIKDEDSGFIFSPTWQPVLAPYDFWETRHGLGYTQINAVHQKIQTEVFYFVPRQGTYEFWTLKIKNLGRELKNLKIFTYVEWCLGNFEADLMDRSFDVLFNQTSFKENTIFATKKRWFRPDRQDLPWDKTAFIHLAGKVDGFDCSREKFLGPFRYLQNPLGVDKGRCQNSQAQGEDAIGVLMKKLKLKEGQEITLNVVLGVGESPQKITRLLKKIALPEKIQAKRDEIHEYWRQNLEKIKIDTPSREFNISVNAWNKYQAWFTPHWSEMDSYYITGGPTYGFRDECQHLLGMYSHDLEFAREKLIYMIKHQFADGKVPHNFDVLTDQGILTGHADDCQWLVSTILHCVKESGDLRFLKHKVAYYDIDQGSILEHLLRALDYTIYHRSPRKLVLHRTADWNDALSGGKLGRGESMMVSNQVCWNIQELLPILGKLGKNKLARKYKRVYREIKTALNKYCWDGKWYLRATGDEGELIGSQTNRQGKIFLNAQVWPIISGVAPPQRALESMQAVKKHLDTEYGPCLFLPSYTHLDDASGIISQFAPGTKENGTIFNHPVAWTIIAKCILGQGDEAFTYWEKTSPLIRGQNPQKYKVEPYVYSEFVYGPESDRFGEGSFTWTTGSAAWFFHASHSWILGVRPTLDGLLIDPCIPKAWKVFKITRHFRGAVFKIKVKNPSRVSKGVKKILVDNLEIKGQLLPDFREGYHEVIVTLG